MWQILMNSDILSSQNSKKMQKSTQWHKHEISTPSKAGPTYGPKGQGLVTGSGCWY